MFEKMTVIVKPTNACNLRCKYCYHEEAGYEYNKLSLDNFEKLLRILARSSKEALITWHGGEPTLMGLPYFEEALKLEKRVAKEFDNKIVFNNVIQTNSTLLDKKWLKFLKKHDISIGVSFDGPHNEMTRQKTDDVLKSIALMRKLGLQVSCLAVITKHNLDQVETYEYFKSLQANCVFNPILAEGAGSINTDLLITAEEFIDSTIKLFDHWIYDKKGVYISKFVSYLSTVLGFGKFVCENASCLGKWISIEPDGSLQACSHFVGEEFCFGNVADFETLEQVFASENMQKLLAISIGKREKCKKSGCPYYRYCHSGCIFTSIRNNNLDGCGGFDCQSFRAIFGHVQEFIKKALEENIDINTLNPHARECFIRYISCVSEETNS